MYLGCTLGYQIEGEVRIEGGVGMHLFVDFQLKGGMQIEGGVHLKDDGSLINIFQKTIYGGGASI